MEAGCSQDWLMPHSFSREREFRGSCGAASPDVDRAATLRNALEKRIVCKPFAVRKDLAALPRTFSGWFGPSGASRSPKISSGKIGAPPLRRTGGRGCQRDVNNDSEIDTMAASSCESEAYSLLV